MMKDSTSLSSGPTSLRALGSRAGGEINVAGP
jgi:hypothetical protein